MKHWLVTVGISVVISISSVIALLWITSDDSEFTMQTNSQQREYGISSISIESSDNSILLNVFLDRPMSCKDVFEILDMGEFSIKNKVYTPTCTTVTSDLIVVTYTEKIIV